MIIQKPVSCPHCSSSQNKLLFVAHDLMFHLSGNFQVYRCIRCGITYIGNPPKSKVISKYYPKARYYSYRDQDEGGFLGTLRNYLLQHYYKPTLLSHLISIVIHNVPAIPTYHTNGKILDIGCGTGGTLISLRKLGWETYGVDIDAKAIKIAKTNGVEHAYVGTYQKLASFPDNFFDAVRLYHVIEHLYHPGDCLRLIRKKLKRNGELIIGTPNSDSLVSKIFGKYWYNLDAPRHLVLFNPKNLELAVRKNGFSVQKTEFCSAGGILGSLGYLFSEKLQRNVSLLSNQWLVILVYPIEWILDKAGLGDIFVAVARKGEK